MDCGCGHCDGGLARSAVTRRSVLSAAVGFMAGSLGPGGTMAAYAAMTVTRDTAGRRDGIGLVNFHTGERFQGPYRAAAGPLSDAMAEINHLLRDFHEDVQIAIDVTLIDLLASVANILTEGHEQPIIFTIYSGYRTPHTNAVLAAASTRVARNSFHMQGKAVDFRVEGIGLARLYEVALGLGAGGVGYYGGSHLHLDSGPFRTWRYDVTDEPGEAVQEGVEEVRRRLGTRLLDPVAVLPGSVPAPGDAPAAAASRLNRSVPASSRNSGAPYGVTGLDTGGLSGLGLGWR